MKGLREQLSLPGAAAASPLCLITIAAN